ncbi:MAG: YceI family protein [Maricaulaceae bacterium]|jgi:polyisoprenoid-binding protein YceI
MKRTLIGAAAAVAATSLAGPAMAQDAFAPPAGAYELDRQHATIHWEVSHRGLSRYIGRFDEFDVDLVFDPEDPAASTVAARIEPTSLNIDYSGGSDFQGELVAEFLKAVEFPEISFTSTEIAVTGEATGTVTGDLTFAGQTHPLMLDVTFNGGAPARGGGTSIGFSAATVLVRSQWGADRSVQTGIGDEVTVRIEAEFRRVADAE